MKIKEKEPVLVASEGYISEEIVVRFRNIQRPQKADSVKMMTDMKKSCVKDYSCCGQIP